MLVTLGDVDSAGVLFFASVYRWHERVFFEWLMEVHQPLQKTLESGRGLPVRSSWADYPASATLGENLELTRRVIGTTGTEFVFQTSWQGPSGMTVAEVNTKHVACERDSDSGRFVRRAIWPELRTALTALEQ
jgi:acyl-CoA thioesterase FadM